MSPLIACSCAGVMSSPNNIDCAAQRREVADPEVTGRVHSSTRGDAQNVGPSTLKIDGCGTRHNAQRSGAG